MDLSQGYGLAKFIPALRNRDVRPDSDTDQMPTPEQIEQAHKEGKRFWFELSGPEKNRYRRLQAHAARRAERRGQRSYNRSQRAERLRRVTIQAQINVLRAEPGDPWYNAPMRDNILSSLQRRYEDEPGLFEALQEAGVEA